MALLSSSYLMKEEKLKKTLFSFEMEQNYIFKEKKHTNDKRLSPWQERKNIKINKINKLTNNSKCEEFLKKVLFKKDALQNTKRHKT